MFQAIKSALPKADGSLKKRTSIDPSVFKCITFLGHALKDGRRLEVPNIIEPMLATGLTPALTICLRELALRIPEHKETISVGLLRMLSQILMNKPLRHQGTPHHITTNIAHLSSSTETADTQSIVLALHTLGTFDFEGTDTLVFDIVLVSWVMNLSEFFTKRNLQRN